MMELTNILSNWKNKQSWYLEVGQVTSSTVVTGLTTVKTNCTCTLECLSESQCCTIRTTVAISQIPCLSRIQHRPVVTLISSCYTHTDICILTQHAHTQQSVQVLAPQMCRHTASSLALALSLSSCPTHAHSPDSPSPRKSLDMEFSEKLGQTAQPAIQPSQFLFAQIWLLFSPFSLHFPTFVPSQTTSIPPLVLSVCWPVGLGLPWDNPGARTGVLCLTRALGHLCHCNSVFLLGHKDKPFNSP